MPAHVLIVGAGSIGARHARNLVAAGARVEICDPEAARAEAVAGATAVPFDLRRAGEVDGVVLASPTSVHAEQVCASLDAGATRVLVEKPLATTTADADEIAGRAGDSVAVAFNLRFHEPVRRLVDLVDDGAAGRVLAVRLWTGSYLPDWRPGVDYRTTYSAQARLGGGILLDAIHEIDLLVWLLGADLDVVGAVVARLGSLDIDVEDTVRALLRRADGIPASVELDYVSRTPRRGIEVIGEDATVRVDWARGVIEREAGENVQRWPADTPLDRSYEEQDRCFLDWIAGSRGLPVDAATGAASVRLAAAIRDAAGGKT